MTSKQKTKALLELRDWLVKWTNGCHIQGGFPCNTCSHHLFKELGATRENAHGMWLGILQIREPAYHKEKGLSKKLIDKVFDKK